MSRFLSPAYQALKAYVPGEQPRDRSYVKLNTNESPYPPAPAVLDAVRREEVADLRLYSDPTCKILREKLGETYGLKAENVFVGNGSDDVLNLCFMAFCAGGVLFPDITYGFYPVYASLHHVPFEEIPLKEDFTVDTDRFMGRNQAIVLANPNAPTGISLPVQAIEKILLSNPDQVVIIDEAYVDFGGESCAPLIPRYENLLVVQTYSKSRSMAGARLGYALGCKALIEDLEKLKYSINPYAINRLTLLAGCATLDAASYYRDCCSNIQATREKTAAALKDMGFEVLPSRANFLFARHPRLDGEQLYLSLKARGVLVRHFTMPRISAYNRITIGTPEEMDILLSQVKSILEETP